jgi:membrane fusion protein (multidrug efflux system)
MMEPTSFLSPIKSAATLVLVCSTVLIAGCSKSEPEAPPPSASKVVVHTVATQPLTITNELPGRTSAYQMAEVRPQVGGLIEKRLFVEGAQVKAGTALYQIDPAIYLAAQNSAKAALAKAQANLRATEPRLARFKALVAIEGVSKQDYDDAIASNEQAKADVQSARAALDMASINLKYTNVYAPISGIIGRSSVTPGALVSVGQPIALTTVQQLDPIYVDVTQSSTDLLKLKRDMDAGKIKQAGAGQSSVSLLLEDGSTYAQTGKLQFSDVSVDPSTGNVTLRALFPNPKGYLLPGMYVRAVLDSGLNETAIVVPQQGVTRNPKGQATALLLNKENKVELRILKTSSALGNKWLVTSGLEVGERVIVEGLQRVKPGDTAEAVAAAAPADAAPPAASAVAAPAAKTAQ